MATTKDNTVINTSVRSTMYRAGRKSKITKICIHHWGSNGQKHDNVVSYLSKKRTKNPTSAHYVASAGRINEIVDPKNTAWHAGNGNPYTIGIECRPEMSDGDFETVAQLIAYLRSIYGNLPLVGHRDVLPTACPGKWYNKLSALSNRANEINKGKATSTKPSTTSSSNVWETSARIKGMSKETVKSIQTKLVKAGYSVGSYGVDGSYKQGTTTAVKEFQKKNGLTVDGVAGPNTVKKLDAVIKSKETKPVAKPAAKQTTASKAPAFPLPKGFVYGNSSGPVTQVSGRTSNSKTNDVVKDAHGRWYSKGLKQWQAQMKKRGWTIDVDGRYGPQTEKVATQFKKNKKLGNDGRIGPVTWAAAWDLKVV